MKRKYEVEWYECNLTERRSCNFFTEVAANFYAWWVEYNQDVKVRVLKHE